MGSGDELGRYLDELAHRNLEQNERCERSTDQNGQCQDVFSFHHERLHLPEMPIGFAEVIE